MLVRHTCTNLTPARPLCTSTVVFCSGDLGATWEAMSDCVRAAIGGGLTENAMLSARKELKADTMIDKFQSYTRLG